MTSDQKDKLLDWLCNNIQGSHGNMKTIVDHIERHFFQEPSTFVEAGNEPAYPIDSNELKSAKLGLSKREVFAMNAPTEIPLWFRHISDGYPPVLPDYSDVTDKDHRQELFNWVSDGSYDLPEELKWFQDKYNSTLDAIAQWHKKDNESRYFQWRAHYADRLVSVLSKSTQLS